MFHLKEKKEIIQLSSVIIPMILSVLMIITNKIIFLPFVVISLFLIVGVCPLFKKRENLWMFILVAIAGLPGNIYFSYKIVFEGIFTFENIFLDIITFVVMIFIFFSVEEIVFAVITRLIWKRQYKWSDAYVDDE